MSLLPLRGLALFLGLLTVAGPRHSVAAQEPFPGLDAYVRKAMADWQVPGLALAVVRNDSVLHVRGYGVRSIDSDAAVDDRTLFEIGSATKPFTATLLAMLVDEGLMHFDERVATYLPGFRMYDAYANSEVTLRDVLTHRTGLSRGELMWLGAGVSRDELVRRVRFHEPTSSVRSRWAYNNVMFVVAGQAAARAASSTWEDLVRTRIFAPLGMTDSEPLIPDHGSFPNVATPHAVVGRDSVVTRKHLNVGGVAPAGSINSTARDMAEWLRFQLAEGSHDGNELVSGDVLHETHLPQMVIASPSRVVPASASDSLTRFRTYGLGWFVEDYRGHVHVNHGGNTDGMTSAQGMLPDQGFGVVVLSNMHQSPLPQLLTRYLFDRQLSLTVRDWSRDALEARRSRRDRAEEAETAAEPEAVGPMREVDAYAGTFVDSLYGEAVVSVRGGELLLRRGDWAGPLRHVNGEHFEWDMVPPNLLTPLPVQFDIGPDGTVRALSFGLLGDVRRLRRSEDGDGRGR